MSRSTKPQETPMSAPESSRHQGLYGEDEELTARGEHGLLINGVPFSKVYDQCVQFCNKKGLSTDGNVLLTVREYFEKKGLKCQTKIK
jgi:hypothetical protein